MHARRGVDQLPRDANFVCGLTDAAFEDVADAELTSDLFDVDRFALVRKAGVTSDYEERLEARQRRDDLFYHPIGEVFLLRIAAHILEWKHGNRRLVG